MDENNIAKIDSTNPTTNKDMGQKQIAGAIIIAGLIIAGAIMLKGGGSGTYAPTGAAPAVDLASIKLAPVTAADNSLGDPKAKVTLVMYEDFQCPWCGKLVAESETSIRASYVKNGQVQLVYRDFPFLGEESEKAAEAARCAEDQGKFWDFHDYLFSHQNGENQGTFSDTNLKSFAGKIGLNTTTFNQCFASGQHAADVAATKAVGTTAGVQGTPKGFILKNGKIVDTIDGYMPLAQVTAKLDAALK